MQIHINTDNHITNTEKFTAEISSKLTEKLKNFESHVTRADVFFSDENKAKGGEDDKRCAIEVRLEGLNPVAVTHNAATLREAFTGASSKVKKVIEKSLAKQRA